MSTGKISKIERLSCVPNNYPWGKVGNNSLAARLTKNSTPSFNIDPDQTYAELWMGTHPNNPAHLFSSPGTLLSSHLHDNPDLLGPVRNFIPPFTGAKGSGTEGQENGHIPFLFKVLTCKQALPLQIHPNKKLSEKLHIENPEQFGDVNHKPEIAVALSPRFLGFAAFRPYAQIVSLIGCVKEFALLPLTLQQSIKKFVSSPSAGNLRDTWKNFLKLSNNEIAVHKFSKRVLDEGAKSFNGVDVDEEEKKRLVKAVQLGDEYNSGDGGLFSSLLFLNLVELKKGEAIYVGADGPHAWLEGEIVELMAISDNVLNVGFTDDASKDDPSLVASAVTCTPKSINELFLSSQKFSKSKNGKTIVYSTPFEEFSILRIEGDEELSAIDGTGVAVVIEGEWTVEDGESEKKCSQTNEGGEGTVWFVGSGTATKWTAKGGRGEVWMAFYDQTAQEADVGAK
ncbi:mannose-6-phosphate isomerase, class I [Cryptococcus depauperatus]